MTVLDSTGHGPVLQAQVDRYGPDLTARLTQLDQANAAVRHLYLQAMDSAAQNLGPGTMGAVFVPGGWGGGESDHVPDTWRFDPVVFTQAYAQAGLEEGAPLAQRAFAATFSSNPLQAWEQYHGGDAEFTTRGHTLAGSFELSAPTRTDLDGHPNRERMGWTAASLNPDSHALRPLSLTAPPDLHDPKAVWFDGSLGWVTPSENVVVKQDFVDKAMPVVMVGLMTWASAGALGVAGGAGMAAGTGIGAGAGIVSAMTAGAAFGAIGGFYGGLIGEGRIDPKAMFRGALTGAATAGVVRAAGFSEMGVTRGLDAQGQSVITSIDYAQRALAVTGQATLQGALTAITGGEFKDGFTAGLAQSLGAEIGRGLELEISKLQAGDTPISATEAGALRQFARVAQSAVSLLGNPEDPGHAFALTFVNGLVGDVQQGLTAHGSQTVSPAWASAPDETAAETARLARQNEAMAGAGPQGIAFGSPIVLSHARGNTRVGDSSTGAHSSNASDRSNADPADLSGGRTGHVGPLREGPAGVDPWPPGTTHEPGNGPLSRNDDGVAQQVVVTGTRAPWHERLLYRLQNSSDPESNVYVNWARDLPLLGLPSRLLGGLEAIARGPAQYTDDGQPLLWNERMQEFQRQEDIALEAASVAMVPTVGSRGSAVARSGLVVEAGAAERYMTTLASAERSSLGHVSHEVITIVSVESGEIVGRQVLGSSGGRPGTELLDAMRGNTVTHNHPSGGPLGYDDMTTAIAYGAREFRAVGPENTRVLDLSQLPIHSRHAALVTLGEIRASEQAAFLLAHPDYRSYSPAQRFLLSSQVLENIVQRLASKLPEQVGYYVLPTPK